MGASQSSILDVDDSGRHTVTMLPGDESSLVRMTKVEKQPGDELLAELPMQCAAFSHNGKDIAWANNTEVKWASLSNLSCPTVGASAGIDFGSIHRLEIDDEAVMLTTRKYIYIWCRADGKLACKLWGEYLMGRLTAKSSCIYMRHGTHVLRTATLGGEVLSDYDAKRNIYQLEVSPSRTKVAMIGIGEIHVVEIGSPDSARVKKLNLGGSTDNLLMRIAWSGENRVVWAWNTERNGSDGIHGSWDLTNDTVHNCNFSAWGSVYSIAASDTQYVIGTGIGTYAVCDITDGKVVRTGEVGGAIRRLKLLAGRVWNLK
jgi:hypothetical protein